MTLGKSVPDRHGSASPGRGTVSVVLLFYLLYSNVRECMYSLSFLFVTLKYG